MLNVKCLVDSEYPLVGFINFYFLMSYFLLCLSQLFSVHFNYNFLQKQFFLSSFGTKAGKKEFINLSILFQCNKMVEMLIFLLVLFRSQVSLKK